MSTFTLGWQTFLTHGTMKYTSYCKVVKTILTALQVACAFRYVPLHVSVQNTGFFIVMITNYNNDSKKFT